MKFVFTGGGTGGHVFPNLAVSEALKKFRPEAEIFYIGSRDGPEKKLVEKAGLKFYAVTTGKLRRYFSFRNIVDIFRVPLGVLQALKILKKIKPKAVFAKGGFVSVPVALAAGILKISLVVHESDSTLGLATRICSKFATKICFSFPKHGTWNIKHGTCYTGNPIRKSGSATHGKKFLSFKGRKPILLIAGGSSGSQFLNNLISKTFVYLAKKANVVWLTGKNKGALSSRLSALSLSKQVSSGVGARNKLRVFDFLDAEYLDVLAACDLVISRAGANAIFEIAAAGKPSLLIPLPKNGSRGDQILNADFFAEAGASEFLLQEEITPKKFSETVLSLISDKLRLKKMSLAAKKLAPKNAARKIAKILLEVAKPD